MGRELRRVPLNFDWPIGTIWYGYMCPYKSVPCPSCDRQGYNPETTAIAKAWYDGPEGGWCQSLTQDEVDALADKWRLPKYTHRPRTPEQEAALQKQPKSLGRYYLKKANGYRPTAEEINRDYRKGMGHDAINRWICIEARARRLGVWGKCKRCKGAGRLWFSARVKKLAENWRPKQPPKGPGYQLWGTTSEGEPMTPVFKTLDALCAYAAEQVSTFSNHYASKEAWRKMLDEGSVEHTEQMPNGDAVTFM